MHRLTGAGSVLTTHARTASVQLAQQCLASCLCQRLTPVGSSLPVKWAKGRACGVCHNKQKCMWQVQAQDGTIITTVCIHACCTCCPPHCLFFHFRHHPAQGSTFGIPGVEQYAYFLRDVRHAEAIRAQLIENIALAGVPGECAAVALD